MSVRPPYRLNLCPSNWIPRNPRVSQGGFAGCETKMLICWTVLLAVLNLYVRIKICVATFDTNHSVTDSTQTIIVASFQKLTNFAVSSVSTAGDTVKLSISLRSAFYFLRVVYINGKQMRVLNFIFDLLWTGMGSSVSTVALVGLCEVWESWV
jgi:hypothetical protein